MKKTRTRLLIFGSFFFVPALELAVHSPGGALAQTSRTPSGTLQTRSADRNPIPGPDSPVSDESRRGAQSKSAVTGEWAHVTGVKLLSLKDQTRVMVDLSHQAKFEVGRLKENPAKQVPERIYVDILGAKLALGSRDTLAVENSDLRRIRLGQYNADVVRVVLDISGPRAHRAFMIAHPTQLVIEILSQGSPQKLPVKEVAARPDLADQKQLARTKKADSPVPGGGLRKIVLDPGHGGKDPGAIGSSGIAEKDVVLAVATKLAQRLKTELGVQVVLTRNDDRFVPLEDRTALANNEDADLFISLHVNASPNSEARGIETYYLDNTTDEAAIRLAARENGTSRRNISDLQFILSDMTQNMKLEDSITLAHRLQTALIGGMHKVTDDVRDLGVKKALFHVLVGARMPSVLVELLFITNRAEAKMISQESNQDALVESLFEGIQKFGETNLMAKTL